jgi:single-strand DNA-binding protein
MKNMVNRVQLIGRLGMDPEMRKFDNGTTMARMSLATDAGHKDANGNYVKDTHWHTLVAWGKVAELTEKFLAKGNEVAITGKLVNRSYEDKDGKKRYTTEVQLVEFIKTEKKSA